MKINYTEQVTKPNDLIVRELLSGILQLLLKERGFSDEEIREVLEKIYC